MDLAQLGIQINTSDVRRATDELNRMGNASDTATRAVRSLASQALALTAGMAGLYGVTRLTSDIIATNREMETLRARLTGVYHSVEQGKSAFEFIKNWAIKTPFELQGVTQAFLMLKNYGLAPTDRVMGALTNQAALLGGSQETLLGISRALGQMWGKSKIQGQEVLQMVDQGVPIWELLSKATGKNVVELQKMMEKAELTRPVISALIDEMARASSGANATMMETMNGQISNMADSWTQFKDALIDTKGENAIANTAGAIGSMLNAMRGNIDAVLSGFSLIGSTITAVVIGVAVPATLKYSASLIQASAISRAHTAAIAQNLAMDVARAQSLVTVAQAQVAQTASTQAALVVAREQAVIELQLATTQEARALALGNLAAIGQTQALVTAEMTAAETALASATATATAATEAQSAAMVTFMGSVRAVLNPMALLNLALAAYVGWKAGEFLGSFTTAQNLAAISVGFFAKVIETAGYQAEKFKNILTGNMSANAALKQAHIAERAAIEQLTLETIAYNESSKTTATATLNNAESSDKAAEAADKLKNQTLELVKAFDAQQQVMAAIAGVQNAMIDAQIKGVSRATAETVLGMEAQKAANDRAFSAGEITAKAHHDREIELIKSITAARVQELEKQNALGKTKLSERVDDVSKAYQAILMLESGNKIGQVNMKSGALGQGQALASTLINPGHGVQPFQPAIDEKLTSLRHDQEKLKAFATAHDKELKAWTEQYWNALVVDFGSIDEALKHYGDGTAEYTAKFKKAYNDITGETKNQIQNATSQADIEAQIRETKLKGLEEIRAAESKYTLQSKSELDALEQRYKELTLSKRELFISGLTDKGYTPQQTKPLIAQFDKNTAQEQANAAMDKAKASLDAYNQSLVTANTNTSALGATNTALFDSSLGGINQLNGAFSAMIANINANTAALAELHSKQAENLAFELKAQQQIANGANVQENFKNLALAHKNKETYLAQEQKLAQQNIQMELHGFAQIASAAGQMFQENTTARKTFNTIALAASAAERLAELATLPAKAVSAVATQGQGDPYTAFARIAAMVGIMAGLLASVGATWSGGGAGSSKSIPPPTSPDSGTVLGDSTAKSQSINNTYQLLKDIQAQNYPVLKSIDSGITGLHDGITNVVTRLFQAGGLTSINPGATTNKNLAGNMLSPLGPTAFILPASINKVLDPVGQMLGKLLFGGKVTKTVVNSGIATSPTSIADIIEGANLAAQQFDTIETKKKGGLLTSTKTSYQTVYSALSEDTTKAMTDVFRSIGKTTMGLAEALGGDLTQRVNDYVIPAMTIDLKGLSGKDAATKMNDVLSTALDKMASSVFGGMLGQYQQLGEGMLETTSRIVAEIAVVKDALNASSVSLQDDIIGISDAIVQSNGGLKEFQKNFESFYDKFFTDAEKQSRLGATLQTQLLELFPQSAINTLATGRGEYRKLIAALDQTNPLYAQQYGLLIKLAEGADTWYKAQEEAAKNLKDIMDNLYAGAKSDTQQLYDKYGDLLIRAKDYGATVGQMVAILVSGMKEAADIFNGKILDNLKNFVSFSGNVQSTQTAIQSNIGALGGTATQSSPVIFQGVIDNLYQQLARTTVASDKVSIINSLNTAIKNRYDSELAMLGRVSDSVKQIRTYLDSLKLGDKSPFTNAQKLAEAGAQFSTTLAMARAGDKDSLAAITGKADTYLQASRGFYASSQAYTDIFGQVTAALEQLAVPPGMDEATYKSLTAQYQQQAVSELASLDTRLQDIYNAEKVAADARNAQLVSSLDAIKTTVDKNLVPYLAYANAFIAEAQKTLGRDINQTERNWVDTNFGALKPGQALGATESAAAQSYLARQNLESYATQGLGRSLNEAETSWIFNAAQSGRDKASVMAEMDTYIHGSHKDGLDYVPFDGYRAELHKGEKVITAPQVIQDGKSSAELIQEVKQLKELVARLIEVHVQGTGDIIKSNYDANNRGAEKVIKGGEETTKKAVWINKTKPEVV